MKKLKMMFIKRMAKDTGISYELLIELMRISDLVRVEYYKIGLDPIRDNDDFMVDVMKLISDTAEDPNTPEEHKKTGRTMVEYMAKRRTDIKKRMEKEGYVHLEERASNVNKGILSK